MLQFDQFLYSCIFSSPRFLPYHGNIFNCASIKCICFLITIIGVGIWVFWRLFFSGLLIFLLLAQCEGKVLLLRQHLWQGVLLLMWSMLTLQNWTEIRQLLLSGPSPNYQNIPLIKEISFVLFRQWKALLQIPVRTLIMKFKANLFDNCA